MALPAAPDAVGRRPAFVAAFLLVVYVLVAPPLFLLIPLLLLLLVSRPATGRELLWIGLAALGTLRLASGPTAVAGLPDRLVLAGAVTVTGAFVVLCYLLPRWTFTGRALAAVALTAAALYGWARTAGIELAELDRVVERDLAASIDLFFKGSSATEIEGAKGVATQVARQFSGVLAFQSLVGLALAWGWYHRVSSRPIGPVPGPFRSFRFNDHLVWGAIFTLALAVFPVGATFTRAAQNGLVLWGGLYATRGLAVAVAGMASWPLAGKLLIVAFALPAFPVAIGTAITIGLADTWLDFRGRFGAPERGGFHAD
jgi:hypothetical protein